MTSSTLILTVPAPNVLDDVVDVSLLSCTLSFDKPLVGTAPSLEPISISTSVPQHDAISIVAVNAVASVIESARDSMLLLALAPSCVGSDAE